MLPPVGRPEVGGFGLFIEKLRSWGIVEEEIGAVLGRVKMVVAKKRGDQIIAPGHSTRYAMVLLEGVAFSYARLLDGHRVISSFLYPGEFCDVARHVLQSDLETGMEAITDCSIAMVRYEDLDALLTHHHSLSLGLLKAFMVEASIVRKNALNSRRPALERIAHLLCELVARGEVLGKGSACILQSQIEIADATGLTPVHVNRVFKELLKRGLLAKTGRAMKVADRARLAELAGFDGNYLNLSGLSSAWRVAVESAVPSLFKPTRSAA